MNVPVYATKLTIGLIEGKLKEHNLLNKAKLIEVNPGDKISLGCFDIELIHVNHSIPDAVAVAVNTPAGIIIQTSIKCWCTIPIPKEAAFDGESSLTTCPFTAISPLVGSSNPANISGPGDGSIGS